MEPSQVHVSVGQFESTAIQKLVARGIREDVARAFVTVGLRKQDGYSRYKEIVCKAKFHSFFIHKPEQGAMVPTVIERKTNKFHAPFSMSGKEKAEIMTSFPELDVVCDGTTRNAHAFYANKRLAECELLMSLVWSTALRENDLDPRSVVDLGGNQTQHMARSRGYVHCDNPILSAKDIFRYTVREVYSGVDTQTSCRSTFAACGVRSDFAIAVHSTYDLAPIDIASAMVARGMKYFFGVVNVHPALGNLSSGEFVHDGLVLKVDKTHINYGFVHDSSLSYRHSKTVMAQYLKSRLHLPVMTPSGTRHFAFEHKSVRGSTIVFSIYETGFPCGEGTSISTGLKADKYRISLDGLDQDIEVDREMFDRLVLMAAASRKIEEYNITALFKYAKSLRQRISINSIVLSAGFKEDTSSLVKITVAAMAVASAYHQESSRLFSAASNQIAWGRKKSVFSDVFSISTAAVSSCISTISGLVGVSSAMTALQAWTNDLLKTANSVRVSVATIKEFGNRFNANVLGSLAYQLGKPDELSWYSNVPGATGTLAAKVDESMGHISVFRSGHPDHSAFSFSSFAGYCYRNTYPPDLQISRVISATCKLQGLSSMLLEPRYSADTVYSTFIKSCDIPGETDGRVRKLANGDSVMHVVQAVDTRSDEKIRHCFFAFRGSGTRFVKCVPPSFYTSRCIGFFLFFEEDITGLVQDMSAQEIEKLPNPLYSVVRHCSANLAHYNTKSGELRVRFEPGLAAPGTVPQLLTNEVVERNTLFHRAMDVFENPEEYMSDLESVSSDGVLGETAGHMANMSVGSGLPVEGFTPVSGVHGGKSAPDPSLGGTGAFASRSVVTDVVPGAFVSPRVSSRGSTVSRADWADDVESTDQFGVLIREGIDTGAVRSRTDSAMVSEVASSTDIQGVPAMSELLAWAEETSRAAVATGARLVNLARSALTEDLPERNWHAIRMGLEGDVQICKVDENGMLVEFYSGSPLPHMAVTDGRSVLMVGSLSAGAGPYITYSDLEVWTVTSIIQAVSQNMFNEYSCPVELVTGPAGCGKTTEICSAVGPSDVGLCETKAAARDTDDRLVRQGKSLMMRFSTVDSFLINKSSTFSRTFPAPETLFLDEALRLHAGKIWCLIKIMRPARVVCYGDPKQIPLLPFTPNFEFKHSVFPWTSTSTLKRTYRLPGDITMMLVESGYYDYEFKTFNKIMHGFKGVKQFYQGIFKEKPEGTVVLTYTQSASEDLRREGVKPVMTIGESQGKDLDDVWLFRESDLAKDIYYNKEQTLTAITRVKRSFTFVSVSMRDDSEIHSLIKILGDPTKSANISKFMQ